MINRIFPIFVFFFLSCNNTDMSEELPVLAIEELPAIKETENSQTITLKFSIDSKKEETVSFTVNSVDHTALSGIDFVSLENHTVLFEKGALSTSLEIVILGDAQHEGTEEFKLEFSNPKGLKLTQSSIYILIQDNDPYVEPNILIPSSGFSTPESREGMTLIWQDEFNGTALDKDKWIFDIGGHGWGNNEWEFYTDQNAVLIDGNLAIEARAESFQGKNYTSSRIKTQGKFDFTYGRVDVRAALPKGQGIWPAIWMLGSSISEVGWPKCGEIDIMEMIGGQGRENTVHGTAHWFTHSYASFGGQIVKTGNVFQNEFNVFSIIWDTNTITWLVNDQQYFKLDITSAEFSEFDAAHFILLNLAVGGNWPGYPDETTTFPQHLIVDYVRVFQK